MSKNGIWFSNAQPYLILTFPFQLSLVVFAAEFYFLNPKAVLQFAEHTPDLFHNTAIYSAYLKTGNAGYLYFWVYGASFFPLLIACFLYFPWVTSAKFDFSQRIPFHLILKCLAMMAAIVGFCFFLRAPYYGSELGSIFWPNIFGTIPFAFFFMSFAFAGMVPMLAIASVLARLSKIR